MGKWKCVTDEVKTGVMYIRSSVGVIVATTINPKAAKYIVDGMNSYESNLEDTDDE